MHCGGPSRTARTIDRLRIDRQLEEALANGADRLYLAVVFGIAETTAVRYANAARHSSRHPRRSSCDGR